MSDWYDDLISLKEPSGVVVNVDGELYSYYTDGTYLDLVKINAAGFSDIVKMQIEELVALGFDIGYIIGELNHECLDFVQVNEGIDFNLN